MLKGHTRIELTDVNTGEVIVHEDTNMFTNAIYKTLNNAWTALVGGVSTLKSWHLPLSQKMLGGIALFEDSIEELETNNHFPKGNKVVGMAGTITSDGATANWGSRNTLESEVYDAETRSVKHVWDFGTSEGNGMISAVGLMDGRQADYYGQSAWNKDINRYLNVTSYFSQYGQFIAEFKGDTFVVMVNGTGVVEIQKYKFNFDTVSLNNDLGQTELISKKVVSLPNSAMNYTCTYWFDGDDGYWYGFITCSNSAYNTPYNTAQTSEYQSIRYLQVLRVNKESYAVEYHNIDTNPYYSFPKVAHPIITNNYIVLPISTSNYWRGNGTDISKVQFDKVGVINKFDWTWSVKELTDSNGDSHSMFVTTTASYVQHHFFGCWSNLKLKNGLYQMNDIIFNDDVVVVEQVKSYINPNTLVPANASDNVNPRINLNPLASIGWNGSYPQRGHCLFMLPNEEKEIILIGLYCNGWGNGDSSTWYVYAVPYDGQKLMTINNLSEPVMKTASQTMKITYTITDVVEE